MARISDIMTRDVFTLSATASADQAAWELSLRGITGAPVRDRRGRVVGVLSRSDLTDPERTDGLSLKERAVQDLMTPALFTVRPSEDVICAIRLMVREGIHRLIVTDERGDMVGIVTSSDVLQLVASEAVFEAPLGASSGRAASDSMALS